MQTDNALIHEKMLTKPLAVFTVNICHECLFNGGRVGITATSVRILCTE